MEADERKFLMTCAWMFMRHGRLLRARRICEALVEEEPRDAAAALALAMLLLEGREPARALDAILSADVPEDLAHASAMLETRALRMLGRQKEAVSRWRRYVESTKGAARQWTA